MIPLAVALALMAAILHASWNVLLKTSGDPALASSRAMAVATLAGAPLAAVAWILSGQPAFHAWGASTLSAVLELAYFVLLSRAYRLGDVSLVYPLARGSAPLLAVLAGFVVLRERATPAEVAGVACLLVGILCVRRPVSAGAATPFALLTGVAIAAYTTVDAIGVHQAPVWLYAWMMYAETAVLMLIWTRVRRPVDRVRISIGQSLVLGLLVGVTYGLVLVALRIAPLVVVAPLRESAVVLVTVWGIWRLRERRGAGLRLLGAAAIVAGSALIAAG